MSKTSVNLAGITLRNPVIAASGTCGYIREIGDVIDPRTIGGIVTKSITHEPREGNAPWRIIDLPRAPGMLNAIGLANVGINNFIKDKLPDAKAVDCVVIGSVAGHSSDEYVAVTSALATTNALPAIELNVSCPNTADGLQFGEHPGKLRELLREVKPATGGMKLIVKLSPNVGDIIGMAEAAIEGGADILTLINTMAAMSIDPDTRQPRLSRGFGGMSGPAIHPIAVRMVSEVHRKVANQAKIPIIGLGGVMTWQDAAELILAGATAIAMGTAMFVDPRLLPKVARGLEGWVARQGCSSISELVGGAKLA